MAKYNPSNFKYVLQDESVSKVCREVHVSFKLGKGTYRTFVFVPKKEGQVSKSYYIDEAKKEIDRQIKSGELIKNAKLLDKKHPYLLRGILITTVCVALVGVTGYVVWDLLNKKPEPQPQPITSYTVQFVGDDCNWDKKDVVAANEKYSCKIFPKGDVNTREVIVKSVIMGEEVLNEGNSSDPKDYTFLGNDLLISKPATGNIIITATTRENTFNVDYLGVDCKFFAADDSGVEAPKSAARNSQYKCKVVANDPASNHIEIVGVMMGGVLDTSCYNFVPGTGILTITKYTSTNISIVAKAVANDPDEYPVYFKPVGCEVVSGNPLAKVGENYVCTIKPNSATNNKASIASVAIGGVILSDDKYEVDEIVGGNCKLTIRAEAIAGDVSITAVAVEKDRTQFNVKSASNGSCNISSDSTVPTGQTLVCTLTPADVSNTPRVVAVVMANRVLGSNEYIIEPGEGNVYTLTIPNVLGDVNVFAVAEAPTNATNHFVAIVAEKCSIDESASSLAIQSIIDDTPNSFSITANNPSSDWVNIVSVSMGNKKLYSVDNYTYECDPSGTFNFINVTATNDIVVIAQAVPMENTVFMVDHYVYGCTFAGVNTVKLKENYTEIITVDNPEDFKPRVMSIQMGAKTLVSGTDYTFVENESETEEGTWTLTINEGVITNDLSIVVMAIEKGRDSFNINCYHYECDYSCTDYPEGKVPSGTTDFKATITGNNDLIPSIDYIYMGDKRLHVLTDYTFSVYGQAGQLKIITPITGDIIIYANAHARDWTEVLAKCEMVDGVMTATELDLDGHDKANVTQVTVPDEYPSSLTSNAEPVVAIKEGILNGCVSIETYKTPFVGINKNSDETNYYDHILGKVFGSDMFEPGGTLTWQSFYAEDEDPITGMEGSYKIAKAAIPHSLTKVVLTAEDAVIPMGAFSNCSDIETIEYQANNATTEVKPYAFNSCSALKYVKLPEQNLTTIGRHAFENCTMLRTANISKIETVEHNAFGNCSGIRQLNIPNTIAKVGHDAFTGLSASGMITLAKTRAQVRELQQTTWAENWVDDATFVIYGSIGDLTVYTDKNNMFRFILVNNDNGQQGACISEFIGDDYATSITIPASLTTTVEGTEKTFKVFEIGAQVFYGFTKFKTLTFETPTTGTNDLEVIGNYCFTSCPAIEQIIGLQSLSKLKYIGAYAFDRCTSLGYIDSTKQASPVVLPSGLKEIGKYAFAYCYSLTSVDMSNTAITAIPDKLFYSSGVNVDYQDEEKADININIDFTVSLPSAGVNSLGNSAFQVVPNETKSETLTSRLKTLSIVGSSSLTTIPDNFCSECTELTSFTLTSSANLATIGNYAFYNCALTSISLSGATNTLSNKVTYVGDGAFAYNKISAFALGKNLSASLKFGSNVFQGWTSSQQIDINFAMTTATADTSLIYTNWGWTMGNVRALLSIWSNEYRCGNSGSTTLVFYTNND